MGAADIGVSVSIAMRGSVLQASLSAMHAWGGLIRTWNCGEAALPAPEVTTQQPCVTGRELSPPCAGGWRRHKAWGAAAAIARRPHPKAAPQKATYSCGLPPKHSPLPVPPCAAALALLSLPIPAPPPTHTAAHHPHRCQSFRGANFTANFTTPLYFFVRPEERFLSSLHPRLTSFH